MRPPRLAWWLFIAGLIPLAFATRPLRTALGDAMSFAAAIAYLVVLRGLAEFLERRLVSRRTEGKHET
jgi:hypothetical protein